MSLDFTDDKSTLVQVMAWCRQATSHYLSQGWPRFILPYGVTRPQWVNLIILQAFLSYASCTLETPSCQYCPYHYLSTTPCRYSWVESWFPLYELGCCTHNASGRDNTSTVASNHLQGPTANHQRWWALRLTATCDGGVCWCSSFVLYQVISRHNIDCVRQDRVGSCVSWERILIT